MAGLLLVPESDRPGRELGSRLLDFAEMRLSGDFRDRFLGLDLFLFLFFKKDPATLKTRMM